MLKTGRFLLALLLVASGCAVSPSTDKKAAVGSDNVSKYGGSLEDLSREDGEDTKADDGSPVEADSSGDPLSINDLFDTGTAARGLLRPAPYTEIVLEFDHYPGFAPNPKTVEYIAQTLRDVTKKKVTLRGASELPRTATDLTVEAARGYSTRRAVPTKPPVASIWIGYFGGRLQEGEKAMAASIGATMIAAFPMHFQKEYDAKSHLIESTVILHELGHLLGMTEYGYESPRSHHDDTHPGHNVSRSSVMFWQADGVLVTNLIRGARPMTFDANDLADLKDLRNGNL